MDTYPVYLNRPWMNHSTSDFYGWTITVTAATGALIIAALAILVRIAGESLWSILAFTLHQSRATQNLETAWFRQTQVVLRNPSDSITSTYELVKVGSKWHGRIDSAVRKTVGLALWPFAIFVSFTVAGIFVAKVTVPAYESNQVLLRPTNCGMQEIDTTVIDQALLLQAKQLQDVRRGRAYAGECYNASSSSSALGCSMLPVPQLPYLLDINATDPNGGRYVASSVVLDTGMLNSHTHLGINARAGDRVGFKLKTSCFVLDMEEMQQYMEPVIDPDGNGDHSLIRAKFGPRSSLLGTQRYTWEYPMMNMKRLLTYTVDEVHYAPGRSNSWDPIPLMTTESSEFTLIFIAPNSVAYQGPVYDGVFSATQKSDSVSDLGAVYISDTLTKGTFFSTIACEDQTMICGSDACTPLTSSPKLDLESLALNDVQMATALRIKSAREHSNIWNMVQMQGSATLMANDLIIPPMSPSLPSDQWVKEVTRWFQSLLATIQHQIVEYPNNVEGAYPLSKPDGMLEQQCHSQTVRSTAEYQSFSLSGVLIIVVVSTAVIITSWTLESCVFARKSRQAGGRKRYKTVAYSADSKLQLLRSNLEAAGYGSWSGQLEQIPYRNLRPELQKDIHPVTDDVEGDAVAQVQYYPSKPQSFSGSWQSHGHQILPQHGDQIPSIPNASPYRPPTDYYSYNSYGSGPIPLYENLGPPPPRAGTPKQNAVNSPPMGFQEDEHVPFIRRW